MIFAPAEERSEKIKFKHIRLLHVELGRTHRDNNGNNNNNWRHLNQPARYCNFLFIKPFVICYLLARWLSGPLELELLPLLVGGQWRPDLRADD